MWDPPGGLYLPTPDETWPAAQQAFWPEERAKWKIYEASVQIAAGTPPYWYLGVLATAPQRQRHGLGRAVVAPMLAAADRAGQASYLETASETNVAFYATLGFATVLDTTMPDGPRCWLMRREPRAKETSSE
jgi:GNAT superfamily N-acetyltransferase